MVMLGSRMLGGRSVTTNEQRIHPKRSFFDLEFATLSQDKVSMKIFRGKKVLIVNTASDCGFTAQLNELQQLQEKFKDELVVIGFPSNDFKQQETKTDAEISTFCELNFNVKFLLAKKCSVLKISEQHPVYQWLSNSNLNGWNNQQPAWNFSKYLIDANGLLTHTFASGVSPLSVQVKSTIAAN